MHPSRCWKSPFVWLFVLGLGLPAGAGADAPPDLEEMVQSQGQVIQELRRELEEMRREQQRSQDRVRALEDGGASRPETDGEHSVSRAYVDRRIQAFERTPLSRLFLSGYGAVTYRDVTGDADGTGAGASTFDLRFNPIFHFAMTERLHFNGELEITFGKKTVLEDVELEGGELEKEFETETETEVELEFATIDYLLTDWLSVSAGKFLLPFNIFGSRLHPDWINKMASAPPIYGAHGSTSGIIPVLSDIGVMLSGGTSLWSERSKLNYSLYAVNGPTFEMGHGEPGEAGLLDLNFENIPDDNNDKSIGGRIGFLPVPNLEIGASYLTGRTRGSGGRFNLWGSDVSWGWRGLDLRGEFVRKSRDTAGKNPEVWGYWMQAAYRLREHFPDSTGVEGFLGRLEPVVRWGEINDLSPGNREQLAFGLNFWLLESVPLKLTYELNGGAVKDDRFFAQFAYGF